MRPNIRYGAVLSIVLSEPVCIWGKNYTEKAVRVYYMWLTSQLMQTMCIRTPASREELRVLCLKIEKWIEDRPMDNSWYLNDKIVECRNWLATEQESDYFTGLL